MAAFAGKPLAWFVSGLVSIWILRSGRARKRKNKSPFFLFTPCITSFRRALERTTIQLPQGQASHALRHTFASHFMMNGGNILTLQKLLGHSTLTMTMRYAHLSQEHLKDALRCGPLATWRDNWVV